MFVLAIVFAFVFIPSSSSVTCDFKNELVSMNWNVKNNKIQIHFEHNNLTENRWTSIAFGDGPGMVSCTQFY